MQLASFLWVGGIEDAQNESFLQTHHITHVLNCADYTSPKPLPLPTRPYIYYQLYALDTPGYDLLGKHLDTATEFLDSAQQMSGGVVLVHCVAGMNRSVALAVAYMYRKFGIPLRTTLRLLAAYRPVLTNQSFRRQLQQL